MNISEASGSAEAEAPRVLPPDPAPLARQTLAYGVSGLIVPLLGMITLPVFARVFTRSQYGLIELGIATTSVAAAIVDAGLSSAALRGFYDFSARQDRERRSLMLTGFAASTGFSLVFAAALIALRHDLARWIFGSAHQASLVLVIAATLPALNTLRYVSELLRVRLQASHYLVTSAIAGTVITAISLAGVLALGWRVKGVFFAVLIGNAAAAAYGLFVVRSGLAGRFSAPELRRMLAYGLPLVPATLAAWALALIDRIILSRLGSLSQVGQYAIANRLAGLLLIVLTAFLFALTPFLLATYSENPEQEKAARARALTYFTFVLSLLGLVLTLFAKEIIDIAAPKFGEAYKTVGPLMLGAIGYGLVSLLTTGLSITRKTIHMAALTLLAAGINIGLNFALIPPFGIVGAGVATAVGYGFLTISYYWVSQRVYRTPFEPEKILTMLALASGLGVLGVVPLGPEAVAVPVKLAAVGAFVGAVWLARAMTGAEFSELRKFVLGMIPLSLRRAGT
ncbi:MAG: oligosaccharide flippase family protein [Gaiellaceae bacterium]